MEQGFQATLYKELAANLDLHIEYLDSIRFPGEEYQAAFRDFLRRKYAGQNFDLIIAVLGPAIRAVLPPGRELFPGVPLVFCLLPETLKGMKLGPQVASVVVKLNPKGTVELALKAQPDTRQVVIIAGKSQEDLYVESLARQELREYEGRVAFAYLSGLPLEEVLKRVTNLPRETIILYLTMFEDGLGRKFLPMDALARIAPVANAPIYGLVEGELDRGVVGGSVLSFTLAGRESAELALRVLRGERPGDIPIVEGKATLPMVDWRQLQRWGIDARRLPPGTIVRHKPPSPWELHKWQILGVISLCVIQAGLIVGLLINRARRERAERDLRRRLRFEALLAELSAEFTHGHVGEAGPQIAEWVARLRDSLGLDGGTFFEIPKEGWEDAEVLALPSGGTTEDDSPRGALLAPSPPCEAQIKRGSGHHQSTPSASPPVPVGNMSGLLGLSDRQLSGYLAQLRRGEPINLPRLAEADVPSNGSRAKSLLAIPVSSGGSTCALAFSTSKAERHWPGELVLRLRVVAEIFTSALARWRTQAALQEGEQCYRNVVETQTELICRYLPDTTLTFVNGAYCRYFGQQRDQLMGKKFIEFIPLAARITILGYISSLTASARADSREHEVLRPDGSRGWQQWSDEAIVDSDGRTVEIQAIGRDVSKRRLAEERLRLLTQQLLESQDAERKRIARELHDVTVQNLGMILFNLARLQKLVPNVDGPVQEAIAESTSLAEQVVKELRTVSYLLHPPLLDEAGLVSALQWYVRGFRERSGIEVELLLVPDMKRLPPEVEMAFFRIVQESLTNIHRHSKSVTASIRLTQLADKIVLQIKDQGCGMPPDSPKTIRSLGVGILGMRQRLKQLGGRLEIEASPQGTTVTAAVPLAEKARAAHTGESSY
jgi:PAS domain S-box-containing protein